MTTSVSITKGTGAIVFRVSVVRPWTMRTRGGAGSWITYYSHRRDYRRPNAPFFCDGRGSINAFVLDQILPSAGQQARGHSFIPLIPPYTLVIAGGEVKALPEVWLEHLCVFCQMMGDEMMLSIQQ